MKDKALVPSISFWFIMAGMLAVSSCCSPYIQTDGIKVMTEAVCLRHDIYVDADPVLTSHQKDILLSESSALLEFVTRSKEVMADKLWSLAKPVCLRHDQYVETDDGLSDLQKRVYLRSTELLFAVIDAGE